VNTKSSIVYRTSQNLFGTPADSKPDRAETEGKDAAAVADRVSVSAVGCNATDMRPETCVDLRGCVAVRHRAECRGTLRLMVSSLIHHEVIGFRS
jgi:hypothetical protein